MLWHSGSGSGTTFMEGVPLVFSVKGGVGLNIGWKSMTVHRTANGMAIEIPGAQIIGYYTQVMPQFPKEQN